MYLGFFGKDFHFLRKRTLVTLVAFLAKHDAYKSAGDGKYTFLLGGVTPKRVHGTTRLALRWGFLVGKREREMGGGGRGGAWGDRVGGEGGVGGQFCTFLFHPKLWPASSSSSSPSETTWTGTKAGGGATCEGSTAECFDDSSGGAWGWSMAIGVDWFSGPAVGGLSRFEPWSMVPPPTLAFFASLLASGPFSICRFMGKGKKKAQEKRTLPTDEQEKTRLTFLPLFLVIFSPILSYFPHSVSPMLFARWRFAFGLCFLFFCFFSFRFFPLRFLLSFFAFCFV